MQTKQQHQSRMQRRFQERLQQDLSDVSTNLGEHFLKVFSTHPEPEGQEIADLIKQIDAQWRTYCSRKNISHASGAYGHMKQYMENVVKQYFDTKE